MPTSPRTPVSSADSDDFAPSGSLYDDMPNPQDADEQSLASLGVSSMDEEDVHPHVRRHTNEIPGYDDVTLLMRLFITKIIRGCNLTDAYQIEKLVKLFAEPVYYLRSSLENQRDIDSDSMQSLYRIHEGRLPKGVMTSIADKRDDVERKLLRQCRRQYRFWMAVIPMTLGE